MLTEARNKGMDKEYSMLWLTAFSKFPNLQDNKDALAHPFVQELCRPAVRK